MNLKKSTILAIIGISYTFVQRITGTFLPGLFKTPIVGQTTTLLSLLSTLTIVLFVIYFYKEYVQRDQQKLRNAALLAIVGPSAILVLQVRGLFHVFDKLSISLYNISHSLFRLVISRSIENYQPFIIWVSSIFILYFFIVFYREMLHTNQANLKNATLFAALGSALGAMIRTLSLLIYLFFREVGWFHEASGMLAIILFPLFAFTFITVLYFFWTFYKTQ
jgi:hypothetical protein